MLPNATKKLIIAGGGHASLPLIKMAGHWKDRNVSITLISAEPYLIYSGALPQFMAGFYQIDETAIQLDQLCNRYGTEFIHARITSIDKTEKFVTTSDGRQILYDLLVINVGASTPVPEIIENHYPVKPMSGLLPLREKLQSGSIHNLLIAGAGAAGTELALNLSHPSSLAGASVKIHLIDKNSTILSKFPAKASGKAARILAQRSVQVSDNTPFSAATSGEYNAVIVASGNKPESASLTHPFKTGEQNRILTSLTLQVHGETSVFAAGDTADPGGRNLKQIGVHAVKQGVLLRQNIEALLDGEPLKKYRPYPINPLIISNGPDCAIFIAGRFSLSGKFFAVLKYVLDMHWLEKYTMPPSDRRSRIKLIRDGVQRVVSARPVS